MKWSQKKLEEIYRKAMKRSKTDEAFRKKLQADSASALAEIAGEDLPGEVWLKFIERDPNYAGTFVQPDYISDELDIRALEKVTGGAGEDPGQSDGGSDEVDSNNLELSFVLIISACAVAISVAACGADACGAAAACAAQACGAVACGAAAVCAGEACGAAVCGADGVCAGDVCAGDACAALGGCVGDACAGDACAALGGCVGDACAGDACAALGGCVANACEGDACYAYGDCNANVCDAVTES